MKKYRAAIIGCGRIGSEFDKKPVGRIAASHAGAYFLCPKTDLIAVSDLSLMKLNAFKKKWEVNSVYLDYKKMLRKEKIDILSVCTPPETHARIVCQAALCPLKAIYCEKPMALNIKDSQKMISICKKRGILLMVNHRRRFNPFFQELKEKIYHGFLGRIQQANCYYTRGIFNTAVHILDLFCFLFGQPEWVMAASSQNKPAFKNDPNIEAVIGFKKGLTATIKACDDAHFLILEMDIIGSKGRIRLGNRLEYFKAKKGQNVLKKKQLVKQKSSFKNVYRAASLTCGVNNIIDCLEKKAKPLSSGLQALVPIRLIEAIFAAVKKGRRINLNQKQGGNL